MVPFKKWQESEAEVNHKPAVKFRWLRSRQHIICFFVSPNPTQKNRPNRPNRSSKSSARFATSQNFRSSITSISAGNLRFVTLVTARNARLASGRQTISDGILTRRVALKVSDSITFHLPRSPSFLAQSPYFCPNTRDRSDNVPTVRATSRRRILLQAAD